MKFSDLSEEIIERARRVTLLLMDCDGVLTDGKLYFSQNGEELKTFHVHDGQGIKLWHDAGFESGIITGRKSDILSARVAELNVKYLKQDSKNKLGDLDLVLSDSGVSREQVAYIGDDISDVGVLNAVGFPVLVGNAVLSDQVNAAHITSKHGGTGAVREVVELLLDAKKYG